jgi:hypothetical protein
MNNARVAIAGVAAFVVDSVYGFLVYGQAMTKEFQVYPGIFRTPDAQMAYLPGLFLATLIAMLVMAYVYAKGYEGRGVIEGVRFGACIGVFNAAYVAWVSHATMQIDLRLTVLMMIAGFVEWIVVGIALGAVYKSARPAARSAAGV